VDQLELQILNEDDEEGEDDNELNASDIEDDENNED